MKGYIFLLSAAFFWGMTFIAQKTAMDRLGPATFTGVRFLIGTFCLILFYLAGRLTGSNNEETKQINVKPLLSACFSLGVLMFLGINFQQFGLLYTTPTHAALLTGVYMLFVPIILVIFKRRISPHIFWISILIFTGIYFLTVDPKAEIDLFTGQEGFLKSILFGDFLALTSAVFWAIHIIWLEKCLKEQPAIFIVIGQSLIAGLLSLLVAGLTEEIVISDLLDHKLEFLIGGFFSIALGFSLQAIGQKLVPSSVAALLLSTEALFATIADYVFLDQVFTALAYTGAAMILLGVVLVQVIPGIIPGNKSG